MSESIEKRIEQAWAGSKNWITEISGSPIVALLVNAPAEAIAPGLGALAAEAENLRITVITAGKAAEPRYISIDEFSEQLRLLQDGTNADVSVNWAVRRLGFDLDIHMIVHPLDNGLVSLELDWWSDQVFSEEEDNPAQFRRLAEYFIALQELFQAAALFLSAEAGLDPAAQNDDWVEI